MASRNVMCWWRLLGAGLTHRPPSISSTRFAVSPSASYPASDAMPTPGGVTSSGMLSGTVGGMRTKTSLTLDEGSIPLARSRAEAEGLDVGRWLDRAIRHEAARGDVDIIADWEASLPPDDQTVLAALDAADRHDLDVA